MPVAATVRCRKSAAQVMYEPSDSTAFVLTMDPNLESVALMRH